MSRKIPDNSPRFDRSKSYAIGTLQSNASASDVPERFSSSPAKVLYLSGTDLIGAGMRTCRDFLISKNCHFKTGSAVHFYEVEYAQKGEPPTYKNIFIGSPLQPPSPEVQALSDKTADGHVINNIIPSYNISEPEKMLFKTQSEAIAYYQKCLQEERKQFADERNIYTLKMQEHSDKILDLNLQINALNATNDALQIKYEEANKFADRLAVMHKEQDSAPAEGLADKGIAALDSMLGDGASQQIVAGLATGLGAGIGKLIDFGVDFIRAKGLVNLQQPAEQQPQQSAL